MARKDAEEVILTYIEKLLPGSQNTAIYVSFFASMTDEQFETFMNDLESGVKKLAIISPILNQPKLSVARNIALAEELGHNFYERIWINPGNEVPPYLSPIPYLVVDLPLRRQAQLLEKKISIPEDNNTVDDLTDQPTGKSKGSKISYPEMQIIAALGLDNNLTEFLKYRGGDAVGFNAMNTSISDTGGASLKSLEHLGSTVKSTDTLATFLTCMHLQNSLV